MRDHTEIIFLFPTPTRREGLCFNLSLQKIINDPPDERSLLVHGVHGAFERGLHAWIVQPDGQIWDPVADTLTPIAEYPGVPEATYDRTQALILATRLRHAGPWHIDLHCNKGANDAETNQN